MRILCDSKKSLGALLIGRNAPRPGCAHGFLICSLRVVRRANLPLQIPFLSFHLSHDLVKIVPQSVFQRSSLNHLFITA